MKESPVTVDGSTSFFTDASNEYAKIFVFCKNCGSRHFQFIKKGVCMAYVPCTKCGVQAVEFSKKTFEQILHERNEEIEKEDKRRSQRINSPFW